MRRVYREMRPRSPRRSVEALRGTSKSILYRRRRPQEACARDTHVLSVGNREHNCCCVSLDKDWRWRDDAMRARYSRFYSSLARARHDFRNCICIEFRALVVKVYHYICGALRVYNVESGEKNSREMKSLRWSSVEILHKRKCSVCVSVCFAKMCRQPSKKKHTDERRARTGGLCTSNKLWMNTGTSNLHTFMLLRGDALLWYARAHTSNMCVCGFGLMLGNSGFFLFYSSHRPSVPGYQQIVNARGREGASDYNRLNDFMGSPGIVYIDTI